MKKEENNARELHDDAGEGAPKEKGKRAEAGLGADAPYVPEGYFIRDGAIFSDVGGEGSQVIPSLLVAESFRRNADGNEWRLVLAATDLDGNAREIEIPREDLGNASAVVKRLASAGIRVDFRRQDDLTQYLSACNPAGREVRVAHVGWFDLPDGGRAFVTPDRYICAINLRERLVFHQDGESRLAEAMVEKGTLGSWKKHVAKPLVDNDLAVFLICYALGVSLASLIKVQQGGVNVWGQKGRGKTTLLEVTGSVWGNGVDPAAGEGRSMVRSWNTTYNGLEAQASAHRGVPLLLDELHLAPREVLDKGAYLLTQGEGKSTMNSDRSARPTHRISTGFISAGEKSYRSALERERLSAYGGMLVRFVDIEIRPEDCPDAAYADRFKAACAASYGTAGPAFVQQVLEIMADEEEPWSEDTIREHVDAVFDEITEGLKLSDDANRVAKRFAMAAAAGDIACQARILPWPTEAPIRAARAILRRWTEDEPTMTEGQRAVRKLARFIQKNRRRFQRLDGEASFPVSNQAGYHVCRDRARQHGGNYYAFTDDGFTEALNGCNEVAARAELRERNLDRRTADGKAAKLSLPNGERPRVVWVSAKILEQEDA